jgi:hypothetical protein
MKKILSFLLLAVTLNANANSVQFMGETRLDQRQDIDVIRTVGYCPSPRNQPVYAIKLRVLRQRANIDRLIVQYGNGQRDELHVREDFAAGSTSRWIDLAGGYRCVEKIIISGDTEGSPYREALVQIFGLR